MREHRYIRRLRLKMPTTNRMRLVVALRNLSGSVLRFECSLRFVEIFGAERMPIRILGPSICGIVVRRCGKMAAAVCIRFAWPLFLPLPHSRIEATSAFFHSREYPTCTWENGKEKVRWDIGCKISECRTRLYPSLRILATKQCATTYNRRAPIIWRFIRGIFDLSVASKYFLKEL